MSVDFDHLWQVVTQQFHAPAHCVRIGMMPGVGMMHAGEIEQLELRVGQIEGVAAKGRGILRAAGAMAGVKTIIDSAAVVEEGMIPDPQFMSTDFAREIALRRSIGQFIQSAESRIGG